jgi:hypothetical protein
MSRETSKGKCLFCNNEFSKGGMTKHLSACKAKVAEIEAENQAKVAKTKIFHLVVEGRSVYQYWMHIEIPAKATLLDLDHFLRETWLECCGHLSAFEINGISYSADAESVREFGGKSMRVTLDKALTLGTQFGHEYDFGTTTELRLKLVGVRDGVTKEIKLLAQNEPPAVKCEICGNPATQVCSGCIWDNEGWVCDEHGEEHECGEDMLLPVVNSPRVGMCGYTG